MDPALIKLMRLHARGIVRRLLLGVRTPRGAIFFAIGVLIFGLWLASSGLAARVRPPNPQHVRGVVPLMLLGICLLTAFTSAGDKAIAFTPGEVDFLFPGPFTRRQLLLYKLAKSTFSAALGALVFSFVLLRYSTSWIACYVGVLLMLLLIQFLSTALVLAGQAVSERAWSRGRKVVLLGIVLTVAIGLRGIAARYPLTGPNRIDIPALIQQFAVSDAGRVLFAPFNLFARTFTAERVFPDLLQWGAQAALVDGLLLILVVMLDRNYLEAAAGASQRRYERLRRFRSGGVMSHSAKATARRGLPRPPFLFGAGPIAWRQLTNAVRSARGLLIMLAVLAVMVGPLMVATRAPRGEAGISLGTLLGVMAWCSILLPSMLKFDFRADLDPMESLKTLPLHPWAVAAGQLVAPVVVLTAIQWVLLAALAMTITLPPGQRDVIAAAAVLVVPFNLLIFAAENLIFLHAPSRPTAVSPGDFQLLGRQMFTLMLRGVLVGLGAGVAAVAGVLIYQFGGRSAGPAITAAALILLAEGVALVPLIGRAFHRFDPSAHAAS